MTEDAMKHTGTLLVSSAEAARRLGRSTRTLENWRWKGKGPKFKCDPDTGRFLGYPVEELEKFLEGAVSSSAEAKVNRRKSPATSAARKARRAELQLGRL